MKIPSFRYLRKYVLIILLSAGFSSTLKANPQLDTIDTPTASTLFRGAYSISIWGYNQGGIFARALMGLHDNIFLGVSFDAQNVVGSGNMVFNIPGVAARAKITDGFENFPLLIAVGYDAFYTNKNISSNQVSWKNMGMVYGPYVVFTKPFFLLKTEQNFSVGIRVPAQPDFKPEDTSMFMSLNFPIGQFVPMVEIERIFFNNNRMSEVLINLGLRLELYEDFAIELNMLFPMNEAMSRVLTFEYVGSF